MKIEAAIEFILNSQAKLEAAVQGHDERLAKIESMMVRLVDVNLSLTNKVEALTGNVEALTGKVEALTGRMDRLTDRVDAFISATDRRFRLLEQGGRSVN